MREFEEDAETTVHPQTVIQHFGSWNKAKRKAGLVPRRFATREDLVAPARARRGARADADGPRPRRAPRVDAVQVALLAHLRLADGALREAGFDVPVGEERLERAIDQGAALAKSLGRLPKFADWAEARRGGDGEMLTEWQVYRMLEPGAGRGRRSSSWCRSVWANRE